MEPIADFGHPGDHSDNPYITFSSPDQLQKKLFDIKTEFRIMPITPGTKLRRVVTTHLSDKSAILLDEEIKPFQAFASEAATIWKNHQYPAELLSSDPVDSNPEIYTRGSLIRVVDFPPQSKGHNHRTASLDYGIILSGELEMVLEDGSRTIVRSGDVVVQQAVGHFQNLAVSFFHD